MDRRLNIWIAPIKTPYIGARFRFARIYCGDVQETVAFWPTRRWLREVFSVLASFDFAYLGPRVTVVCYLNYPWAWQKTQYYPLSDLLDHPPKKLVFSSKDFKKYSDSRITRSASNPEVLPSINPKSADDLCP